MLAKIRAFRGIRSADIEISPVALIAGKNHQGKSSICQAVAAALTNSPIPFFRSAKPDSAAFTKGEAETLVNADSDKDASGVRLDANKDNRIMIAWPSLQTKITGEPPQAGKVACGLITPIDMIPADRAKFYAHILQSDPTQADFIKALADAEYDVQANEKLVSAAWDKIEISGWDAIYSQVREQGAKQKGAWENTTGERYGGDKAESYRPAGYVDELDDIEIEDLDEAVSRARQKVDDLATGAAVSADAVQRLTADAELETALKGSKDATYKALEDCRAAYQKAEDTLAPLRLPHLYPCKHCGGMNKITFQKDGTFNVEESDLTEKDLAAMAKKREKAVAEHKAVNEAYGKAREAVEEWERKGKRVEGSGDKLNEAIAKTGNTEAIAAAQDELRTQEAHRAAKTKYLAARDIHRGILRNAILIGVLAPTGLRQTKLQEKLAVFNKVLAGYCETASYPAVSLSPDLEVTYGARSYLLLSDSEKYRCRAIIQIAASVYERSNMVILDGADILDGPGRNGLFSLLLSLAPKFYALVAMTFNKPELVPDISKMQLGTSYWVENGGCEALPKKAGK